MKFQLATAIAVFSGLCVAEPDDVQSKPFTLTLVSADKKVDGSTIASCHSGAGIQSLCYGKGGSAPAQTYRLNVTTGGDVKVDANKAGVPGSLNWPSPNENLPPFQPMYLSTDYSSNVALPLVTVDTGHVDYVSFNKQGYMVFSSNLNDRVNPPKYEDKSRELNNWYACTTYYGAYTYPTLAWVFGDKPQNPSCVKVSVKRTFK
ncbi:hypothetical protein Golomagni_07598 [Golovinomyces magnicellulatus]|nr:hypothetical protein Golomagni_07598 [Golovinomyces magnicellulatus]